MTHETKYRSLIDRLNSQIGSYGTKYEDLSWREKILILVEAGDTFRSLGEMADPEASRFKARERIRRYLVQYVGVPVSDKELAIVGSISEYGRRIRELRKEDGYRILTGVSNDPEMGIPLKPTEYMLVDTEPDREAARRWKLANRIRRSTSLRGAQAKILEYLKENVNVAVTTEELAYVGKSKQYARRTRELRTEENYLVATRFTGRPDLCMGEYVLESLEPIAEPHDRRIPFDVQKIVYKRDGNKCQFCGWTRERWSREDPRRLELHHVHGHADGGQNTVENLVVLCSKCHDDLHAKRIELPKGIIKNP